MVVRDNAFDMENLNGYEYLLNTLETSRWESLDSLIKETIGPNRFKFYTNAVSRGFRDYMSYVR